MSRAGAVRAVPPGARLVAGLLALAACIAAPAATVGGTVFVVGLGTACVAASGLPARRLRAVLLLGAAFYAPLFLLLLLPLPWTPPLLGAEVGPFTTVWGIALKGLVVLLISASVLSALEPAELHGVLHRAPLPPAMRAILLQILHQTGVLVQETSRMRHAMAVRGARGPRMAAALSRSWLGRVAARATRVADAMEVRGYGAGPGTPGLETRPRAAGSAPAAPAASTASAAVRSGRMAVTAAGAALAIALLLRVGL